MAYSVFANVNQISLELKDYDSVEDFFLKQFNISSATLEKLRNKFLTEEL